MTFQTHLVFFITLVSAGYLSVAQAQESAPFVSDAPDLRVTEKLGAELPLDAELVDAVGQKVKLAQYFKSGKPVIVTPVYYSCPLLCNLVLNGFVQGLKEKGLTPGIDFDVVTFSIDFREKAEIAQAKKKSYLDMLGQPDAQGWHFLTTDRETIKTLTDVVGFPFRFDQATQQYLHPSALVFVTDQGQIVRYLYGTYFPGVDIQFALQDAGMSVGLSRQAERALFLFDDKRHRYTLSPARLLISTFGVAFVCLGPIMVLVWRRFGPNASGPA